MAEKILEDPQLELLGFIDSNAVKLPSFVTDRGASILGGDDVIADYKTEASFHLALGGHLMEVRKKLIHEIERQELDLISIIHLSGYVAPSATIGKGVSVLVNAIVHTNASVGDFTCVNTGAIVEHDCTVGNNVFLQPNSVLAGSVVVKDNSVLGVGVSVRDGVTIGENCIIGGGAFVSKDIPDNSLAYGVPAKVMGTVTNNASNGGPID